MGDDQQVARIERALERIEATLAERCTLRKGAIERNSTDIDKAFDKMRDIEKSVNARFEEVRSLLHKQDRLLAKWSGLASLGSAILTAVLVKFFVG